MTEVFYSAPDRWLTAEYPTAAAAPLPTHLVMYDVLKPVSVFIASGIPCGMFAITIFQCRRWFKISSVTMAIERWVNWQPQM